uniref:Uncharacterized protein n=1 Tax=Alexandrium andersonii TaxID=327968 RepID=A0A7S2NL68_9DINO|mmetsp:Transcript_98854/g.221475  ORF Transcript_98854/g.221475 Transcript_98854/m.221475 type:complete len:233 (+) Transcript_98854:65-763(+)
MSLRLLAVACAAAALPWGACGLRMSASGPPSSEYSMTLPINWTKMVADAIDAPRDLPKENKSSTNDETQHQVEPGKMDVEWEIKDLEEGAEIEMFWDHGCSGKNKPVGKCTFDRSDANNPAGFKITTKKPLKSTETVDFTATVKVLFMPITKSMECPICDGTCAMATPASMPDVTVPTPTCPVPETGFRFELPNMDFSTFPPESMRVQVNSECKLLRADGSSIANVVMMVHM